MAHKVCRTSPPLPAQITSCGTRSQWARTLSSPPAQITSCGTRSQWARTLSSTLLSAWAMDTRPLSTTVVWCTQYNASVEPSLFRNMRFSRQVSKGVLMPCHWSFALLLPLLHVCNCADRWPSPPPPCPMLRFPPPPLQFRVLYLPEGLAQNTTIITAQVQQWDDERGNCLRSLVFP